MPAWTKAEPGRKVAAPLEPRAIGRDRRRGVQRREVERRLAGAGADERDLCRDGPPR